VRVASNESLLSVCHAPSKIGRSAIALANMKPPRTRQTYTSEPDPAAPNESSDAADIFK
jgi:hypothetical protein